MIVSIKLFNYSVSKRNKIELFLATFAIATGILNLNFTLAINLDSVSINGELVAKKSGGRSGGGSFKSRPSRSSSPSYRESAPVPILYQDRQRNSPVYLLSSRSGNVWLVNLLLLFIFLFVVGVLIYLTYKILSTNSRLKNRTESKIDREINNDRVTISMLQVALSSQAINVQQDLSELSSTIDTSTASNLISLMRESALVLLRNNHAWTHVLSSSNSLDINHAESAFDQLAFTERSKFSSETLSNVDGTLKTKTADNSNSDDFAYYVVVTLILGTADDNPLFTNINTEEALREAVLQLAAMRDDYLMKFELLWTPQKADEYLTDEELLMEYTNIIPLA